jgi:hypothetical protein
MMKECLSISRRQWLTEVSRGANNNVSMMAKHCNSCFLRQLNDAADASLNYVRFVGAIGAGRNSAGDVSETMDGIDRQSKRAAADGGALVQVFRWSTG